MTIDDFIGALGTDSLQSRYFQILSDQHPHCRKCAQQQIGSEQLAGGGGVQELSSCLCKMKKRRVQKHATVEAQNFLKLFWD